MARSVPFGDGDLGWATYLTVAELAQTQSFDDEVLCTCTGLPDPEFDPECPVHAIQNDGDDAEAEDDWADYTGIDGP